MSHYSLAQKPSKLKAWAKKVANLIKDEGVINPVLVYTGMSGIAGATALSWVLNDLKINHAMVYIRKEHEQSHGEDIEYDGHWIPEQKYIFVDDFICSGSTMERCYRKLKGDDPDFKGFHYISLQGPQFALDEEFFYTNRKSIVDNLSSGLIWMMDFSSKEKNSQRITVSGNVGLCKEYGNLMAAIYTKKINNIPFWACDWRRK